MASFKFILLFLAAATSVACMVLLFRGYARTGARLLFWSALCFVFLSINNTLLFVDIIVFPTQVDLRVYRILSSLTGVLCLLYAFIWELE